MTKKRRSKLEIYIEILEATTNRTGPTRIMYSCNLSWGSLRKSIKELLELDLIQCIDIETIKRAKREYLITATGQVALDGIKNNPLRS